MNLAQMSPLQSDNLTLCPGPIGQVSSKARTVSCLMGALTVLSSQRGMSKSNARSRGLHQSLYSTGTVQITWLKYRHL
jgi:hypothetical protein